MPQPNQHLGGPFALDAAASYKQLDCPPGKSLDPLIFLSSPIRKNISVPLQSKSLH
jgi:hypothetical protein